MDMGAGKCHSGILPLACQPQAPAPHGATGTEWSAGTSAGTAQAKQLTGHGHSPIYQQRGCSNTLRSTAVSGHSPAQQKAQNPASCTSTQAVEPRPSGASSQRPWDPALPRAVWNQPQNPQGITWLASWCTCLPPRRPLWDCRSVH